MSKILIVKGPLYVGAAGANLFTALMASFFNHFDFAKSLSSFPSLALICIMGATHVVTFKANMAIMLILTLTISSFNPLDGNDQNLGGDYSAVFPLLVVSVFVSMMLTRSIHFYKQSNRCDLIITKQSLCIPSTYGNVNMDSDDESGGSQVSDPSSAMSFENNDDDSSLKATENSYVNVKTMITPESVEHLFNENQRQQSFTDSQREEVLTEDNYGRINLKPSYGSLKRTIQDGRNTTTLDTISLKPEHKKPPGHRRIRSADVSSYAGFDSLTKTSSVRKQPSVPRSRSNSESSKKSEVFGEIRVEDMKPDIMSQGRIYAATNARSERRGHRRSSSSGSYL